MFGGRRHFVQRAVHAVTDFELILERLEMNVAGAVLHRLVKDEVDELDDRRFIGQVLQIGHPVARRRHFPGDIRVGAKFLEDVADAFAFFPVKLVDGLFDLRRVGDHHLDLLAGQIIQLIDDRRVERVGQGDAHGGTVHGHRNALVHARV